MAGDGAITVFSHRHPGPGYNKGAGRGDIKGAAAVLKEVVRTKPEKNRWGGEDDEVSNRAFYETGG